MLILQYKTGVYAYENMVLEDNPSAYWKLNDTGGPVQDSSGNGHHLTDIGAGLTFGNTGIDSTCVDFGNNDTTTYMRTQSAPDTPLGDGVVRPMTFNAWIYITSHTSTFDYLFVQGVHTTGNQMDPAIYLDSSGILHMYWYDGTARNTSATNPVGLNSWRMLSIVWETDNTVRFFENAVPNGTDTGKTNWVIPQSNDDYGLGNQILYPSTGDMNRAFDGLMDEVSLYRSALTQARLLEYYNKLI